MCMNSICDEHTVNHQTILQNLNNRMSPLCHELTQLSAWLHNDGQHLVYCLMLNLHTPILIYSQWPLLRTLLTFCVLTCAPSMKRLTLLFFMMPALWNSRARWRHCPSCVSSGHQNLAVVSLKVGSVSTSELPEHKYTHRRIFELPQCP